MHRCPQLRRCGGVSRLARRRPAGGRCRPSDRRRVGGRHLGIRRRGVAWRGVAGRGMARRRRRRAERRLRRPPCWVVTVRRRRGGRRAGGRLGEGGRRHGIGSRQHHLRHRLIERRGLPGGQLRGRHQPTQQLPVNGCRQGHGRRSVVQDPRRSASGAAHVGPAQPAYGARAGPAQRQTVRVQVHGQPTDRGGRASSRPLHRHPGEFEHDGRARIRSRVGHRSMVPAGWRPLTWPTAQSDAPAPLAVDGNCLEPRAVSRPRRPGPSPPRATPRRRPPRPSPADARRGPARGTGSRRPPAPAPPRGRSSAWKNSG